MIAKLIEKVSVCELARQSFCDFLLLTCFQLRDIIGTNWRHIFISVFLYKGVPSSFIDHVLKPICTRLVPTINCISNLLAPGNIPGEVNKFERYSTNASPRRSKCFQHVASKHSCERGLN